MQFLFVVENEKEQRTKNNNSLKIKDSIKMDLNFFSLIDFEWGCCIEGVCKNVKINMRIICLKRKIKMG